MPRRTSGPRRPVGRLMASASKRRICCQAGIEATALPGHEDLASVGRRRPGQIPYLNGGSWAASLLLMVIAWLRPSSTRRCATACRSAWSPNSTSPRRRSTPAATRRPARRRSTPATSPQDQRPRPDGSTTTTGTPAFFHRGHRLRLPSPATSPAGRPGTRHRRLADHLLPTSALPRAQALEYVTFPPFLSRRWRPKWSCRRGTTLSILPCQSMVQPPHHPETVEACGQRRGCEHAFFDSGSVFSFLSSTRDSRTAWRATARCVEAERLVQGSRPAVGGPCPSGRGRT